MMENLMQYVTAMPLKYDYLTFGLLMLAAGFFSGWLVAVAFTIGKLERHYRKGHVRELRADRGRESDDRA